MNQTSRTRKLVKPAMQLKLAGIFMVTSLLATIIQAATLNRTMMALAEYLPNDGEQFRKLWPEYLYNSVGLTAVLIVLMVFGVGVAVTHRFAGPLHRIESYLEDLKAGRASAPCKLRKGDQLQELCTLLNEATAELRARAPSSQQSGAPSASQEHKRAA